jgi:hypothetical protein
MRIAAGLVGAISYAFVLNPLLGKAIPALDVIFDAEQNALTRLFVLITKADQAKHLLIIAEGEIDYLFS